VLVDATYNKSTQSLSHKKQKKKRSGTTYGGHLVKGEFFSNMFTHTYSQSEALTTPVEPTTLDIRRRTTTDTHQIMFAQFPSTTNKP